MVSVSASTKPSRNSIALRWKNCLNLDEFQKNLDLWLYKYNNQRIYQWKRCQGRTPMDTLNDNLSLAKKMDQLYG